MNKSIEAFENTTNQQREHLWQIAIVQVLFEYQVARNKHCHVEQPDGSKMLRHPSFVRMSQIAKPSKFDMCSVGDLSHPQTGKPIRKKTCGPDNLQRITFDVAFSMLSEGS